MMKNSFRITLSLLFIAFLTTACSGHDPFSPVTIASRYHLTIKYVPGPNYYFKILSFQRPATIACWLETLQGKYVDTLFVSHNAKTGVWFSNPQGQPGALPVWTHLNDVNKNDAVSGATLKAGESFTTNDSAVLPAGVYMVKFEVNKSFDYNDSFPAKLDKRDPRYSGDNGQPSVIYDGRLKIGGGPATVELQAVGTGAANGQDGKIHDLKGITTALRIIDKIEVSYQ